jgi:hypothetical protein
VAFKSVGEGGAGPRGLGAEIAAAPGRRSPGLAQAGAADGHVLTRQSVAAPPEPGDGPEELAVCDLCGLVSRLPRPPVCPVCGGGYG